MAETCPRVGKLIRGCRWEGRYDTQGPSPALQDFVRGANSINDVGSLRSTQKYVRDVCRTCGKTIEREKT